MMHITAYMIMMPRLHMQVREPLVLLEDVLAAFTVSLEGLSDFSSPGASPPEHGAAVLTQCAFVLSDHPDSKTVPAKSYLR